MPSPFELAPVTDYRSDTHSQNGEDGVLAELTQRLGISDTPASRWCVEFGAWDGRHLSNTFALVEFGWNAVYIEADPAKYLDLKRTAAAYPSVIAVNAFVQADASSREAIDRILERTPLPTEFDLISIDIDSFDLDVWESLSAYSPRIVVIEIDSSIPPGVLWRHGPGRTGGNSFSSTLAVAARKGYVLVGHTGNCIFVREDLLPLVGLPSRYREYPELLFDYGNVRVKWMPRHGLFRRNAARLLPDPVRRAISRLV